MVNSGEVEPQWVAFQYEKLPIFCYWCGVLNHDEKDCALWTDNGGTLNTEDQQYKAWLRAPLNNLQQPQVASKTTTPKPSQSRAPPRPPHPMPLTHTTSASTTVATMEPVRQSNHPVSSPPHNSENSRAECTDKYGDPVRPESLPHTYCGN